MHESISASSKTIFGALPPNSRDSLGKFLEVTSTICFPTSVEPVKDILEISSFLISSLPASSPLPGQTLITPLGIPHSSHIWASSIVPCGVSSDGFITIVHPAARAGPFSMKQAVKGSSTAISSQLHQ